ncbi:hypothetical protein VIBNISO65_1550004 [Vibrio nigripulchritudo SO65]|uniref:Uncharacterized protein n=1 Tax=Vibrio nigripulchritudo SOn1 TaxID=1238450 RepID=A0AAV2VU45_9VIBR|nr:hypothetical protein VIBNIAM115_670022 [Vibrio nigripulchritudo AM115]CCN41166.1 hypothetical protein VIBNIFTn2_1480054 [Vibrio nigripulchritudo FTn2]CCN67563.1 hypothetical protein VIBNIPon4_820004 [Vibrio nigripulchritudo POn4]CCN76268.1 hypothetical protein VIBNISO65_1550004 [Vibrio nigripulchritudo SO65]CCO47967.1 hypothetical protein VIBNISOn1_410121 [Vibrio nigripulchritudo SOn1]
MPTVWFSLFHSLRKTVTFFPKLQRDPAQIKVLICKFFPLKYLHIERPLQYLKSISYKGLVTFVIVLTYNKILTQPLHIWLKLNSH